MRMRAAWVYLQLPFPVTPTRPTDSPVFLVARPSSTARFSHRAVSREESFRAFSLRVFCSFLVRRVVRKSWNFYIFRQRLKKIYQETSNSARVYVYRFPIKSDEWPTFDTVTCVHRVIAKYLRHENIRDIIASRFAEHRMCVLERIRIEVKFSVVRGTRASYCFDVITVLKQFS